MSTPLEAPRPASVPGVRLRHVGDKVDVALARLEERPVYVYGSQGEIAKSPTTGKPKRQVVLTGVVLGGTGTIVVDDVERTVRAGDVVTLWIGGRNMYDPDGDATRDKGAAKSWVGAKRDHAPNIGDVLRWEFEAEIPGKGTQPRRVRTCRLRAARPDEASIVAQCEAINRAATATPLEAGGNDPDPEPF